MGGGALGAPPPARMHTVLQTARQAIVIRSIARGIAAALVCLSLGGALPAAADPPPGPGAGPTDRRAVGTTTVRQAAVAARATTTTLALGAPRPGEAGWALTATVSSSRGMPVGVVRFWLGRTLLASVPVVGGRAVWRTNGLPRVDGCMGAQPRPAELAAAFEGARHYADSTSNPVPVPVPDAPPAPCGTGTVTVSIPVGMLSITTPYTPAAPLDLGPAVLDLATSTYSASAPFRDIAITDTRAGELGFTASAVCGPFRGATDEFDGGHAGLTDLRARQVPGNALQASDVVLMDHPAAVDGLAVPRDFARYASGRSVGTVRIDGVLAVAAVPSSVDAGVYRAVVTFTAV